MVPNPSSPNQIGPRFISWVALATTLEALYGLHMLKSYQDVPLLRLLDANVYGDDPWRHNEETTPFPSLSAVVGQSESGRPDGASSCPREPPTGRSGSAWTAGTAFKTGPQSRPAQLSRLTAKTRLKLKFESSHPV